MIKKLKSDLLNVAKSDGKKIDGQEVLRGLFMPRRNILERHKIRNNTSPKNPNSTYSTLNQNAINNKSSALRQSDFTKKSHFKSAGIGSKGEVFSKKPVKLMKSYFCLGILRTFSNVG